MIYRSFIAAITVLLFSQGINAQDESDALRYTRIQFEGTARFSALSGAFGALGGDFSVMSTNPAGIGIYRKSEFTFTPGFYASTTNASHYGNSVSDTKYNLNVANIGWIATLNHKGSGWMNTNFGVGYNRIANFHRRFTYQGTNNASSLIEVYLDQLNADGGIDAGNIGDISEFAFGTNLAWQTYLIDTAGGAANYFSALPNFGEIQQGNVISSGSMGETVISLGSNYEDKLYIGGTVGIESVNYYRESNYLELAPEGDTTTNLTSFELKDKLHTRGVGYNFKFGMIFRPNDFVRLGAAIHSPTFFDLHDNFSSYMTSDFNGGEHYEYGSPKGAFDYQLISPYKAIGSLAIIFGKAGLLSAEYEFVDYSAARLQSDSYDFINENNSISSKYVPTGNIKAGTEWRFQPFSIRAGYAYYGSPYSSLVNNDGSRQDISAGLGFRDKGYYIDLGYIYSMVSENYYLYDPSYVEATVLESSASKFLLTIGFRY